MTKRVPLGYICGFPLKGGELYAGSVFFRSEDKGPQGVAIEESSARFGGGKPGQSELGFPVCKKNFNPWTRAADGTYVRAFGCAMHHGTRAERISKVGLREGWESFEQWPYPKCT
jgi:hypothetical protein